MEFTDRLAVKVWLIDNALGKRNLSQYDKVLLHDRKREILAEQARQKIGGDKKSEEYQKSLPRILGNDPGRVNRRQNETDYKIAKAAGTSEDTVRKVRTIDKYGSPELKEQVRNKEVSINKASMQASKETRNNVPNKSQVDAVEAERQMGIISNWQKTIRITGMIS